MELCGKCSLSLQDLQANDLHKDFDGSLDLTFDSLYYIEYGDHVD